jgi:alpha-tubulin suppressor-like RCC1 family protein|tara:strand:+ start:219 stop:539 length:321 start_codon:yes stop_codon:yes gene_type:complete
VSVPKSLSFDILIKLVACGAKHSLILSKRGELFSIGSNSQGQLGLNDRELEYTTAPLLIQDFQTLGAQVEQLACGANHNLVLTRDGQLFSWGSNQHGECGQIPNSH